MTPDPIQTTLFDTEAVASIQTPDGASPTDYLLEITDSGNYKAYNPVPNGKVMSLVRDGLLNGAMEDRDKISRTIEESFAASVRPTLREDTVVIFPAHFLPSMRRTPYGLRHKGLFSEVMCSLRSRENERPRILCLADNHKHLRNPITGAWQRKYRKTSDSSYGVKETKKGEDYDQEDRRGANDPVIPLDYKSLSVKHYDKIGEALKLWLLANPEVKNIVFSDPNTAAHTFKNTELPASFGAGAYKVFDASMLVNYGGRAVSKSYKVTYMPSILHLNDFNDRAYDIAADMLSIIMCPGKPFFSEDNVKEISTVEDMQAIIKYAKKKGIELSLDLETSGTNPNYTGQCILCAAISQGTKSWFFFIDHPKYKNPQGMDMLKELMQSGLPLVLQNATFDIKWYKYFTGLYPKGKILDTMLMDHWLHESQGSVSKFMGLGYGYGMDNQIPRYLRVPSHKDMIAEAVGEVATRNPRGKVPVKKVRDTMTVADLKKILKRHNIEHDPTVADPTSNKRGVLSDDDDEKVSEDKLPWYEPGSNAYAELPRELLKRYNSFDAMATYRIFKAQCYYIDQECGGRENWPFILTHINAMCIENAVEMELEGAPIDYDALFERFKEVDRAMHECHDRVKRMTNNKFDLNSVEQVLHYLIDIEGVHKDEFWDIKTEKLVADTDHLTNLKDDVAWIDDYISYKRAAKLRNTYLIPIFFKSYRGRLYYSINLTGTATGRLSASDPNIQNFPSSLKIQGKKVGLKEIIRVPEGYTLADMDLSSAEVKVLTVVCPDEKLIDVLSKGLDAHSYTASLISKATDENPMTYEAILRSHKIKDQEIDAEFTKEDAERVYARKNAKSITFGSIYRAGARGLASQLSFDFTPPAECATAKDRVLARQAEGELKAEKLLDILFNSVYPELKKTFDDSDKQVLFKHYGESIFGRRRRYYYTMLPVVSKILKDAELHHGVNIKYLISFIPSKHNFRQNVNFLVQSPTTDYMQIFLHYIRNEREKRGLDATFHFTVHDSGVFSFDDTEANKKLFREICDDGMNKYIPSVSDKLKVIIGYGLVYSRLYSPV